MNARARWAVAVVVAGGVAVGCSAVLGIDADRHVVESAPDSAVDAGVWWCQNAPIPDASPGPLKVQMFVDDVSSASSQNSFAGNPIPGASIQACTTLDIQCATPVGSATTNDAGIAFIEVPSDFSGYYQLMATGFTSAIASRTPQLSDESVQQGMADLALIAAGGGLAGVKADPTLATAIVSVLDCNENPASNMTITVGAPGPTEKLVYLADSLPSASATQTDATGSAIIYNATPGTLRLTASFAAGNKLLRSVSTLARVGWVTFVQIRLDQSFRVPITESAQAGQE
jgi:hypothetical protein